MPLPASIVDRIRSMQRNHTLTTAQRDTAVRALQFIARHELTPGFSAHDYANRVLQSLRRYTNT
jgi:hypothetical protein